MKQIKTLKKQLRQKKKKKRRRATKDLERPKIIYVGPQRIVYLDQADKNIDKQV